MGYRHSRDELLDAAIAVTLEGGLAGLTFARVGARLGISDRTVVYYFPTKPDLVVAVALALGARLEQILADAFGEGRRSNADLIRRAWPVLTQPEGDAIFSLYFELVGLASAGTAPYADLAPAMVEGWVQWLEPRCLGRTSAQRRRQALAAVAQIDGLLLVRRMIGADAARQAMEAVTR